MASKAEAMEHMKRGGVAALGRDHYRNIEGIHYYKWDDDTNDSWDKVDIEDGDWTLLPIEPVDLLTPEERERFEFVRRNTQIWLVALIDRLAPKPVKPIPKWVEDVASKMEADGMLNWPRIRAAARKAMENGNG